MTALPTPCDGSIHFSRNGRGHEVRPFRFRQRHRIVGDQRSCIATTAAQPASFALPFKGEDFGDEERVSWARPLHSPDGVQKFGYDLEVQQWNAAEKKWSLTKDTGKKNSDWFVYGKPVHAMRAGTVIACWRNAPENPEPGKLHDELPDPKVPGDTSRIYGGGNGFWIKHDDGSRAEYAHFMPGSAPSALCPHDEVLLPTAISSPDVTVAWPQIRVAPEQQVRVEQGQFLGFAGNVGTSSNPHLHVHVETGGTDDTTKSGGTPMDTNFRSGLAASRDEAAKGPWITWTSFAGKPIPPGPTLVWPSRTVGGEYARHGFPAERFGAMFQHLTDSGFWPEWIDTYNVGGANFLNFVWRRAQAPFLAWFLVDAATYQRVFNEATSKGFAPVFVESSASGGQARYTAVFVLNKPGTYIARHGMTYEQHKREVSSAAGKALAPVNVSVVSLGGKLFYTDLFRGADVGSVIVQGEIPEASYQAAYSAQAAAGRAPISLDAYMHNGVAYIAAVFGQPPTSGRTDRHGMSAEVYQREYIAATSAGQSTRAVTGIDGTKSEHRFAATWWK